jgi:hypothetical protein
MGVDANIVTASLLVILPLWLEKQLIGDEDDPPNDQSRG